MSYMDVKTAADRWELTERRITTLCRDGRIAGAKKEGGFCLFLTTLKNQRTAAEISLHEL